MPSIATLTPSRRDYPRLGVWIFCIAWLIGNIALFIGFNGGEGEVPAMCGFVIACIAWWWGYRLGGTKGRLGSAVGVLVLTIWTLNFVGAMIVYFRYYVTDLFFWVSASALLTLVVSVALTKGPAGAEKSSTSPTR